MIQCVMRKLKNCPFRGATEREHGQYHTALHVLRLICQLNTPLSHRYPDRSITDHDSDDTMAGHEGKKPKLVRAYKILFLVRRGKVGERGHFLIKNCLT